MAKQGNQGTDSGGSKALLLILGVGGVFLLLCCGGVYWGYQKVAGVIGESLTMDPDEVRTMTSDMSNIQIPDSYQPSIGMDLSAIGAPMKMVMYGGNEPGGPALILMQAPRDANGNGMSSEDFEDAMNRQGHGQNLQVSSRERRIFNYAGEHYAFEVVTGVSNQNSATMRQLSGVFPSQGGVAFVTIIDSEENWDDEAVTKMIESTGGQYVGTETDESEREAESTDAEPADASTSEADAANEETAAGVGN